MYSKTLIYCGFWGKGNIRDKSGFAVNQGFACLQYSYKALFGEKLAVTVNQGLWLIGAQ